MVSRFDGTAQSEAYVDKDRLDLLVASYELEGLLDRLGRGASADVEEVCRVACGTTEVASTWTSVYIRRLRLLTAVEFQDVHRRHGKAGTVDEAL